MDERRSMMAAMPQSIAGIARDAMEGGSEIIGVSGGLRQVWDALKLVAPADAAVLIQGETGTGKELIARAIHQHSRRKLGPYVTVNCAAIPAGLFESELFGHERGAYTGALTQTTGRFQLADQGTLFLDEVGDLPLELQPKLLRVLQEHEFERVGGTRAIQVNVRMVAATNLNLAQLVRERKFRADLFYRLNVFPISIPPLRDRREDIPDLAWHFALKFARRMDREIQTIPQEVMDLLQTRPWPGNIRELQNFIERAVIMSPGTALRPTITEWTDFMPNEQPAMGRTLAESERDYIIGALRDSGGVISGDNGAAARLGMKRTTLQHRMQKLGIKQRRVCASPV
jgi:formate hydrogenlyase transcriptional activator